MQQIIQAEFCHLAGKSPDEVAANAAERVLEGSRYKQVVRFTDEIGKITELIFRICDLESRITELFLRLENRNPVLFHNYRIDRNYKKLARKKAYLQELMVKRLGYAEIAIEDQAGDPFRIMEDGERYELCVAASKANHVMVFLMKGELLADKLEGVAHIT